MSEGIWTIRPCPHRQASGLAKELGLSEITASVLVRRGYGDPEVARAFLAGEQPLHDPFLLGDMGAAVERIRAAIAAGKRICVHGDYDVDGICATVLAVLVLRELGAEVEWHLPSRLRRGLRRQRPRPSSGLRRRLRARPDGRLRHHCRGKRSGAQASSGSTSSSPTTIVRATSCRMPNRATRPSDYPCQDLLGPASSTSSARRAGSRVPRCSRRHLDLVALAKIADRGPAHRENRSLAIAGCATLARTQNWGCAR